VIAAVGSRLVEAAAKKMLHEFFRKLGEQLENERQRTPMNTSERQ
jgi:carbon monoxide dehydrogenase subunit G